MLEMSLLQLVLITAGVLVSLALLSCLCCFCMKWSDYKMKAYVIEMAKEKGIKVDPDKLDGKHTQSPLANENCTIFVPEVGIIL